MSANSLLNDSWTAPGPTKGVPDTSWTRLGAPNSFSWRPGTDRPEVRQSSGRAQGEARPRLAEVRPRSDRGQAEVREGCNLACASPRTPILAAAKAGVVATASSSERPGGLMLLPRRKSGRPLSSKRPPVARKERKPKRTDSGAAGPACLAVGLLASSLNFLCGVGNVREKCKLRSLCAREVVLDIAQCVFGDFPDYMKIMKILEKNMPKKMAQTSDKIIRIRGSAFPCKNQRKTLSILARLGCLLGRLVGVLGRLGGIFCLIFMAKRWLHLDMAS